LKHLCLDENFESILEEIKKARWYQGNSHLQSYLVMSDYPASQ